MSCAWLHASRSEEAIRPCPILGHGVQDQVLRGEEGPCPGHLHHLGRLQQPGTQISLQVTGGRVQLEYTHEHGG